MQPIHIPLAAVLVWAVYTVCRTERNRARLNKVNYLSLSPSEKDAYCKRFDEHWADVAQGNRVATVVMGVLALVGIAIWMGKL